MRAVSAVVMLALVALAGCGGAQENPGDPSVSRSTTTAAPSAAAEFGVSSPAFAENTQIPEGYSCDGRNVPPQLRWQKVPPGTESLAVVVDDPDAPSGLFVHWVVTGIPPSATEIGDGALPEGAVVSLNSADKSEYLGPCPPAGTGVHHYRFQLYALNTPLVLTPTTPVPESTTAIADTTVGEARTVGLFGH